MEKEERGAEGEEWWAPKERGSLTVGGLWSQVESEGGLWPARMSNLQWARRNHHRESA